MKKINFLLSIAASLAFCATVCAGTIKDKTFIDKSYTGVRTIRIDQNVLEVEITETSGNKTAVKCHVEEMTVEPGDYRIVAHQNGDVLEIRGEFPSLGKSRHYGYSFRGKNKGYLRLAVPSGVKVISVRNSSGAISVSGLSALDSLKAASVSGAVRVQDVSSAEMSLRSSSGSVAAERISGQTLKASCVSGSVRLGGVKFQTLDATSSSGLVAVSQAPDLRTANIKSVSGNVNVTSLSASQELSVRTSSGTVRLSSCKAGGQYTVSSVSGDLSLTEATGETLSLRTSSGNISIEQAKVRNLDVASVSGDARVRAPEVVSSVMRTSSGGLTLYFGSAIKNIDLKSVSGDMRLYLKNDLKNNAYRINGVSGSISIQGLARAERSLQLTPDKALTEIAATTSSGDVYIDRW